MAIFSAIGSVLGAKATSKAAGKAADATLAASQENNALAREMYGKNEGYLSPYVATGQTAGNYLNAFLGLPTSPTAAAPAVTAQGTTGGMGWGQQLSAIMPEIGPKRTAAYNSWLQSNPGATDEQKVAYIRSVAHKDERQMLDSYGTPVSAPMTPAVAAPPVTMQDAQNAFGDYLANSDYGFQFATGSNSLNSGYAGAGTLQSGAAMKALEKYRQNLQSGYRTEYTSALGNQQGVGLSAGSALAGVGQNYVNTISANNNNAADSAANAYLIKGQNNPLAAGLGSYGGSMQALVTSAIKGGMGG